MLHAQRQSTFILPMHPHHMIFTTIGWLLRHTFFFSFLVVTCCVSGELGLHTGCMHDLTDDNRVLLGVMIIGLQLDWRILFPAWRTGC